MSSLAQHSSPASAALPRRGSGAASGEGPEVAASIPERTLWTSSAPARDGVDLGLPNPIRVTLHSVGLAKYRVPVYAELAKQPGIDLTVCYSETPWIKNAEPEGFKGRPSKFHQLCKKPLLLYVPDRIRSARRSPDQPHVIVLPWDIRYPLLVPTIMRAHMNGIGVVLWGHGYSKRDHPIKKRVRDWVARLADAVLLYYPHSCKRLLDMGFDARRVFAAPNAIDQAPIQAARAAALQDAAGLEAFRACHRIAGDPVLLFVSRLMEDRHLEVLLDALPRVCERHPRTQLVIIGDGDTERERLRADARTAGVTELDPEGRVLREGHPSHGRVRFVPAIYEEQRLAPWFLSAKAMVFPGALGLTVLHAFGYGLPVVAANDPSLHGPEFISLEHEKNGLTFPAFNRAALAAELTRLIGDDAFQRRLSENALASVLDQYTIPKMAAGMRDAIVTAARRARR